MILKWTGTDVEKGDENYPVADPCGARGACLSRVVDDRGEMNGDEKPVKTYDFPARWIALRPRGEGRAKGAGKVLGPIPENNAPHAETRSTRRTAERKPA